ncbi:MAG: NupC/NupG family nucleoside CNT transporter [Elusimicrobia bacterium]|nr:NupC/NupG family nucleoside CNT transporter [Candidatus Liberimonas magnetica]
MYKLCSFTGIIAFIALSWAISENRRKVNWATVFWGMLLQFVFALLILKTGIGRLIFDAARIAFDRVVSFSDKGASFVFGNLVNDANIGAMFAFKVLPIIIFVSSLMGMLFYLGIIQFFVRLGARLMKSTMKLSGAESFGASLFAFMGIEGTTAIGEYITGMTRSELFVIMSAYMATIASSVMVTYSTFGAEPGHLLSASIMSVPAAILIAKIMIPETETPKTMDNTAYKADVPEKNIVEAAANGASLGVNLALQVGAMLIAFISLVWMLNSVLKIAGMSFEGIMSYVFWPFAVLMGIPPSEAMTAGKILGIKTVFNEFLGYLRLKDVIASSSMSPRSIVIMTYALCGFANFGSMAILIGGIGGIAPQKKAEASALGIKSIISGTLASFITACIAGILY